MNSLVFEWAEAGQLKTQTIFEQQPSKNPGTVRIGRDASLCDVVLSDFTVSPLHAEIFFNPQQQCFYLRNLRDTNPPIVNGLLVPQGEVMLDEGTTIQLGAIELKVRSITLGQPPYGYTPTNYATQTTPPPYQPTVQATQYSGQPQAQNSVQPTMPVSPGAWQSPPPVAPPPSNPNYPQANYPPAKSNQLPLLMGVGVAALVVLGVAVGIASNSDRNVSNPNNNPTTKSEITPQNCVVVGDQNLNVRTAPNGQKTGKLVQSGTKVGTTGQEEAGWIEISSPIQGWIYKQYTTNDCSKAAASTPTVLEAQPEPPPQPQQPATKPSGREDKPEPPPQPQQPATKPLADDGTLVACRERWDATKCKSTDDYYNPNEPSQQSSDSSSKQQSQPQISDHTAEITQLRNSLANLWQQYYQKQDELAKCDADAPKTRVCQPLIEEVNALTRNINAIEDRLARLGASKN